MREIIKNKEKQIVAFYILYFGWLFALTTLTVDPQLQNYFTLIVALFYFIFLRDFWDPLWFTLFAVAAIANETLFFDSVESFNFESANLASIPLWLPLSWGTTAVALRKFYVLVNQRIGS